MPAVRIRGLFRKEQSRMFERHRREAGAQANQQNTSEMYLSSDALTRFHDQVRAAREAEAARIAVEQERMARLGPLVAESNELDNAIKAWNEKYSAARTCPYEVMRSEIDPSENQIQRQDCPFHHELRR